MPRPSTRLCVGVSVCEISLSLSLDEHHRCLHDRQHADTAACTRAEHHHHHRGLQLATATAGITLFEIFLSVNKKGEYKQQVPYLRSSSGVIDCMRKIVVIRNEAS
ncbi:hypothetical protein Vadar_022592 [Vaccinium darrowii]|uniref:Uncharacterized protein n=1 Tax=Vaccinium darrowii TaxID=229202 RepID=A0ACB7X332_9ERIC|nr:hypothetical protein Vadar_022592 [Vaccinium darrowii]